MKPTAPPGGLCARVCSGMVLSMQDKHVQIDQTQLFGCIACGQCMAICPQGCISVEGRDMLPSDVFELPARSTRASYEQLAGLMQARRSIRHFQNREVETDLVQKILDAASTSPMGIPPSEVSVMVVFGRDSVQALRDDLLVAIQSMRWFTSPIMLALMRPFMGKENIDSFRQFINPALDIYGKKALEGEDVFLYDAPLALFFYASNFADPADPYIPATYAMLAGEALGLGTCMLGFPGLIIKYNKKIKQKYQLPTNLQPGIMVIFGYPTVQYHNGIKRRFASVKYY